MASQRASTAQQVTPLMTFVDWEWESRHQCDEANCTATEEALFPAFCDWTLFPDEERAVMTPKAASSTAQAETSTTAQRKVPRQSEKRVQQRKAFKGSQKPTAKLSKQMKLQDDDKTTDCDANQGLHNCIKTEQIDSPSPGGLSFQPVPRTPVAATPCARIPTPPVENMGQMFAPIEALGEDFRWYQANGTLPEPLKGTERKGRR